MQINDFIPKHAAFIAAVILLFSSGSSQAENYAQNFDGFADGTTNLGDGTVIVGQAARVQGGRLQLTRDGEGLGHSSFTIPAPENSSLGWTATWDFEIFDAAGEGNPADGFSFNYGNFVLGERGNAEEGMGINGGDQIPAGVTTNISFEVDTYNNGDPEQGVSISGVLNGTDPGNLAFTNGIILNDGQRVTGTITASYDATLGTVSFTTTGLNTNANFINVPLPAGAVGDDTFNFGFSARVGGANHDLFIDNLEISTNLSLDSDNDGLPDSWEQRYGLDPNDNGIDPDENGLVNVDNGPDGDPDGDGVNNEDEFANKTNPVEEDTDSDGLNDGVEANTGTNPLLSDTDADGLNDGEEVFTHETNPNIFDSDGDGFSDGTEITLQTDPNDEDSAPDIVTIDLSFPPLLGGPGARTNSYLPNLDEAGLSMQQNHYDAEVLFNDQALQNYVRVALSPGDWPPNQTKTQVQPYFDHGGGGFNTPSGGNLPYIDGGGDHFSIRINGYVLFKQPGVYTIYLRADDTNFFLMDTPSGRIGANHNSIGGGDVLLTVNVSSPGYYPFDNVMAEQTGGDWGDVSITGPGIPQRAALGDVAAGSPAIYTIKFNPADTDNDLLPDWWERTYTNNLDDLSGLIDSDLDGDTLTDFDEYENGTNPNNEDTDGDGLEDNVETNSGSFVSASDTGTDPTNADTDGDGLNDNVETNTGLFLSADDTGTDPFLTDTDEDAARDGFEVTNGTNPVDDTDFPVSWLVRNAQSGSPLNSIAETRALFEGVGILINETITRHLTINFRENSNGPFPNAEAFPLIGRQHSDTDDYAIKATGNIFINEPGTYTFGFNSDDGGGLYIDGNPVVVADVNRGSATSLGAVELSFGNHDMEFLYWERGGGAQAQLFVHNQLGDFTATVPDNALVLNNYRLLATSVGDESDSDGDQLIDVWEISFFNNLNQGFDDDPDNDGLSNGEEQELGTKPNSNDSDGDGLSDGVETNTGSFVSATDTGTDPTKADSDGDGLGDGVETATGVFVSSSDTGSDPNNVDSDGDLATDGNEVNAGSNPNDSNDSPSDPIVLGLGTFALLGGDLTDPENDGDPEVNLNYNATFNSSEEPGFGGGEFAFNVFDNRIGENIDKWCCGSEGGVFPAEPIWVSAAFEQAYQLTHFTISSANDTPERDPRVWEIQGSNDGLSWETIFRQDDPNLSIWTDRNQVIRFNVGSHFPQPDSYSEIRFICFATGLTGGARYQLAELEFFGEEGGNQLEITNISYDVENEEISLTWLSRENKTYSLFFSQDLLSFDADIDDSIPAAAGETTTFTFQNPIPGGRKIFFKVYENEG